MAKARRKVTQPASAHVTSEEAVLGQELGVPNLMPADTWNTWSGAIPEGTMQVGKDPLAPNQDELIFMLRRDGQARAMLNLLTLPIRAAFAKSEWIAPESGGGEKETEFANQMWNLPPTAGGMSVPRSMFLRQTLLALPYGFSAFEIVKEYREDGPLKGKIVLDKMGYRDPRTVTFLTDENGNFMGFRQVTQFANRFIDVVVNKENAWYWAANEEENPMYGVSYFESAFQHYQMKRKMYYIGHLAAQFAAVPGRIGEIPLGASNKQIAEFKQGLAKFAFNTAMAVPPNFKVSPFNNNSNFDFIKIVDHHNTQMAASILAKFLQQEDRQVLIDNGKADASADMFVQLLEAITYELSESWTTKLMPQFIDYNFGSGVYPVHQFAPLTDATKEAILNLFTAMVGLANVNCTPEFIRTTEIKLAERLGYDIDYTKVAEEEAKVAEQMQKEQAAQEAQQSQPQSTSQSPGQDSRTTGAIGGKAQPSNPSATKPLVTATAKQQAAMEMIGLALNDLIEPEDVPEDFAPEGEVLPETEED